MNTPALVGSNVTLSITPKLLHKAQAGRKEGQLATKPVPGWCVAGILLLLAAASSVAQQGPLGPKAGYLYPAGGERGTTVQVTVGGDALAGVQRALVTGVGVTATVGKFHRPMNPGQANRIRERLEEAQQALTQKNPLTAPRLYVFAPAAFTLLAREAGLTPEEIADLDEFRRRRTDPKRQDNPQIEETLQLTLQIAADAPPGVREIRLAGPAGLSAPVRFVVGSLPERREVEPNDAMADTCVEALPAVINGQVMPGDVDRFRFAAPKGMRLVASAATRSITPFLADAVPGWFQATLRLLDPDGREIAYDDTSRGGLDPVILCELPRDGDYTLEIRDAIYRGREDFVYRISLGQLPYVTRLEPMGARQGATVPVRLVGWNLPSEPVRVETARLEPGIYRLPAEGAALNQLPFTVEGLPTVREREPNDTARKPQPVSLECVIEGRMDRPGDIDVYAVRAPAGAVLVAEVMARRLGSPLDASLRVTDASSAVLAFNDDWVDKAAGEATHHADSRVELKAPAGGVCLIAVRDSRGEGGAEYAYRLRISRPKPDFALRVTPAGLGVRAGMNVPFTVFAVRKDGFDGDITLRLTGSLRRYTLSGARIPAGQEKVQLTLGAPPGRPGLPETLTLEGIATIGGLQVRRTAVPAEDRMQAFAYRHLTPAQEWLVATGAAPATIPAIRLAEVGPLELRVGGSAKVKVTAPPWLLNDTLKLGLNDPPAGIELVGAEVTGGALLVEIRAVAGKAKPGDRGNLVLEAFRETVPVGTRPRAATVRRLPLGVLPAFGYEVAR